MYFDENIAKKLQPYVDENGKTVDKYPNLRKYSRPLKRAERPIVGREVEMDRVMASLMRPELCNVMLLAAAGSGKTALVQGCMMRDKSRYYIEVEPSRIIADVDKDRMANVLKVLFDETEQFCKNEGVELVLFIDEFHQIVQLSDAAVEALKPLLADSGTRGIRVIAATTFVEFRDYIKPNQPLVERLQRINLEPPSKEMVVEILRGMARRYGVDNQFYDNHIFELIYDLTNRYIPANAQPRKSLLVFDSMVGWYRYKSRRLNKRLLADVIYESSGVNVAFTVDATKIKNELDAHVYAQEYATDILAHRLQVCVADLQDKTRPMSSFLFCGATGVGKRLDDDTMIPVYVEDNDTSCWKRNGDLQVGDKVFNRFGQPVTVTQVFHYKNCKMLEVELTDGRTILADPEHLWQYKSRFGNGSKKWKVADTKTLMEKNANKYYNNGRNAANVKFVIPMNQAVQWSERNYRLHPYVLGVAVGNGCLTDSIFSISSSDEDCIKRCADLIGAEDYFENKHNYTWYFHTGEIAHNGKKACFQTKNVLTEVPELVGVKSGQKFIPDIYKTGSVDQRWWLIRGLFDTDGTIDDSNGRYNVSYSSTSEKLVYDIQDVLYSLGVSSSVNCCKRDGKSDEYHLHVKIGNNDKEKFFWISRKRDIAMEAKKADLNKKRIKKFGEVIGIRDIRETNIVKDATCIMVDDDEHLYQAGQFIVTHNTEMTKQLARVLFNDERRLIRFDMSEYANADSLKLFRDELTARVWESPYSIILLDEIEKSCAEVTRLLLQVLDDGRLTDENNRQVSFVNAYIIITTNAGSEVFKNIAQYEVDDSGSGKQMQKYMKLIRTSITSTSGSNKFPPELLGRIDAIIPFQPLSEATQVRIVETKLRQLSAQVRDKHNIDLQISKRVIDYLVKDNLDTDSDSGGARAVISKLNDEVTAAVSTFINANPEVQKVGVYVEGKMAWEDKSMLESKAKISVRAMV